MPGFVLVFSIWAQLSLREKSSAEKNCQDSQLPFPISNSNISLASAILRHALGFSLVKSATKFYRLWLSEILGEFMRSRRRTGWQPLDCHSTSSSYSSICFNHHLPLALKFWWTKSPWNRIELEVFATFKLRFSNCRSNDTCQNPNEQFWTPRNSFSQTLTVFECFS